MKYDQIQSIKKYSVAYEKLKVQFHQLRSDLEAVRNTYPESFPIVIEKEPSDTYFDIKYLDRTVRVELGLFTNDRVLGVLRFSHRTEEPIPRHTHFLNTYFDVRGNIYENTSETISEIELTMDANLVLVNALCHFLETNEFKSAT